MVGPPPLRCWPHLFFFNLLVLFESFPVCHLCPSCCQLTNNVVVRLYHGWLYMLFSFLRGQCALCVAPLSLCAVSYLLCAPVTSPL